MSDKENNKIVRCPSCGAGLDSFKSKCPYCGNEIRDVKLSKGIEKFTDGLYKITSKELPKYKPKDSLLRKVIGTNINEEEKRREFELKVQEEREQEIADYISNYVIPNSKEDILEFMILASNNVDLKTNSDVVKEAWSNKMNQIYEKAKLSLKGEDLDKVKEIYDKKKSVLKIKKYNKILYIVFGIIGYFALLALIGNVYIGLSIIFIGSALFIFLYSLINGKIKIGSLEISKNIIKYGCIALAIIGVIFGIKGYITEHEESAGERDYYNENIEKHDVTIDIVFEENVFFNKYNVDITVYDNEDTLHHGKNKTLKYELPDGKHDIVFSGDGMQKTVELKVKGDTYVKYSLKCKGDEIVVKELDYSSSKDSVVDEKEEPKEEEKKEEKEEEKQPEEPKEEPKEVEEKKEEVKKEDTPVYYSTNNENTVKNGNSGIYAYKDRGTQYNNYYIIDFTKKKVYFFSEGNEDDSCLQASIVSGDLNSNLVIKYVYGKDKWNEGLKFESKNQPEHLILEDNDHFTYDFYPTSLSDAQSILKTKKIIN